MARRAAFAAVSPIEAILLLVMLGVAVGSGSVTLLGETLRSALIAASGAWACVVVARARRDAGQRYEFGVGKLEQAGNTTIAVALAVTGLWTAGRAFNLIIVGASEAEPLGLALAATANAVYTAHVGSLVWARSIAKTPNEQPSAAGPPALASISRLVSLLIVQATLTAAALAKDPAIALALDCAGGIFVGLLMTVAGIRMLWEAVLDLIDHPLQGRDEEAIVQLLLEQGIHAEELIDIRSRRSGRDLFLELTIDPVEVGSFDETRQRLAHVRQIFEDRLHGIDVSIRLQMPEG